MREALARLLHLNNAQQSTVSRDMQRPSKMHALHSLSRSVKVAAGRACRRAFALGCGAARHARGHLFSSSPRYKSCRAETHLARLVRWCTTRDPCLANEARPLDAADENKVWLARRYYRGV